MPRMPQKMDFNYFYCPTCGQRGYELPRPSGHRREKFHRKWLYCPHCRKQVNMIECKDDEDIYEFKIQFAKGAIT